MGRAGDSSGAVIAVLLAANTSLAVWVGTQYLAHRLHFDPWLGSPLLIAEPGHRPWLRAAAVVLLGAGCVGLAISEPRRSRGLPVLALSIVGATLLIELSQAPLYAPQRGMQWLFALRHDRTVDELRLAALRAFGVAFTGMLTLTLAARPRTAPRAPSDSHGSAQWGSGDALAVEQGLELGRLGGRLLRYAGDGHVVTIAPTRTGKGVGAVIPNLLRYPGSIVVTDPKGENHAVTARRRVELGSVVHALDPFGVVRGHAAFNPLDLLDVRSPDAIDDAWMLADMLVSPEARAGEEVFWTEEARALLVGLILHVAASEPPELRTLTRVRTLLTRPPDEFRLLLDEMLDSDAAGGLVARSAARVVQKADRERSGVVSSAQSHTHFLDSPRMARVLGSSSFELADIKRANVTLYLVLPPERIDSYRGWLRVMIASAMLAMTRVPGPPPRRVLFLLDEFANLGRMRPVERAVSLAAAYGASFWLLLQDLAQLRGTYPDRWQTFLANADVLQAFGVNDWETADLLSKLTGETTIAVEGENESSGVTRGMHVSRQESATRSVTEQGRRLLLPDEVRRMGASEQLLFGRGSPPVRADRLNYLRDVEYAGLFDENPMHAGDLVRQESAAFGS